MTCIIYQLWFFKQLKKLFELKHENWPGDESLNKENIFGNLKRDL